MQTDTVSSALSGCQEGLALVARIKRGDALPDELHVTLQALRAAGEGEKLRTLTRQVQKALEGTR
ncbi:MAG: hypothetical protein WA159_17300 [Variovorax sp.]